MSDEHFTVESIGHVEADEGGFALVIAEPYRQALIELDGFSHINVLWWCHLLDDPTFREMTIAEPRLPTPLRTQYATASR